jgi:penicillin-binding protein 1A
MMTDMLRTVVTSGTGTRAQISGHKVAGKTGTTQLPDIPAFEGKRGERDAWFVGYTPELVGVVWLGYDKTTTSHYLHGLYGGSSCAPIWKKVMVDALRHTPSRDIDTPSGIVWASVDAKSGKLPSDLTPKEFVIKEMFAKGTVPTEVSDVWVQAEVCAESNQLPTSFCPEITTKSFFKRPIPYTGSVKPEDANLEVPTEPCAIHGFGEGIQLKVCNDPRHNGQLYLANVPSYGGGGGCPEQYVEIRTFAINGVPGEHCPLPEHQLDSAAGGNGNNGGGFEDENLNLRWSRSGNGVTLKWNRAGSGSVIYSVVRWSSKNSSKTNVGTTSRTSWTDRDLQGNTVYYYQITAINTNTQERIYSNSVSVD